MYEKNWAKIKILYFSSSGQQFKIDQKNKLKKKYKS